MVSEFRQLRRRARCTLLAMSSASEVFRRLHAPDQLLILPNAWDAASARVVEACGARAVATTSAGLAWAHGRPDGNALAPDVLAAAVAEIVRAVRVPVSVDVEAGYSDEPAAVALVVAAVIDAGAVGINLEDGGGTPELLCAKIEAVRTAARRAGVDLFVNARTDVFLRGLVPAERAVETTVERGRRYLAAGADGLFVPYLQAADDARRIAHAIEPASLNLMAVPGLPGASELRTWGVRRLSAGSALASAALGLVRRLGETFLREGRSAPLFEAPLPYGEMNGLLARA